MERKFMRDVKVLEVGHESQPRVRDAGELRLRHALFAPLFADERADFLAGGQFSRHIVFFPNGNETSTNKLKTQAKFPSGNNPPTSSVNHRKSSRSGMLGWRLRTPPRRPRRPQNQLAPASGFCYVLFR